jgi:hypothetical protein
VRIRSRPFHWQQIMEPLVSGNCILITVGEKCFAVHCLSTCMLFHRLVSLLFGCSSSNPSDTLCNLKRQQYFLHAITHCLSDINLNFGLLAHLKYDVCVSAEQLAHQHYVCCRFGLGMHACSLYNCRENKANIRPFYSTVM